MRSKSIRPILGANHLAAQVREHIRDHLKNSRIVVYNKRNWAHISDQKQTNSLMWERI
jgi:hypothetical protein